MTAKLLNTSVNQYFKSLGRAINCDNIVTMLEDSRKETNCESGNIPACLLSPPSNSTKRQYQNLATLDINRRIISRAQMKTEQQFTAENSIISAISYLFTVVSTHFMVGTPNTTIFLPDNDTLSTGTRLLMELVSKANKNPPIRAVLPRWTYSTDDSTILSLRDWQNESFSGTWLITTLRKINVVGNRYTVVML